MSSIPASVAPGLTRYTLTAGASDRDRRVVQLGEAIATLAACLHAATYELLVLLREFDACAGWNNGCLSCAHWLHWRTGIDLGAAREKVRVARALAVLPNISAAMQRGELSYAKVRALTRIATPANEPRLLDLALAAIVEARCPTVGRRHHRSVHEGGFMIVQQRNGAPMFYRPDGTLVEIAPAMHRVSDHCEPLGSGACTTVAAGDAAPFDINWAIDVLYDNAVRVEV